MEEKAMFQLTAVSSLRVHIISPMLHCSSRSYADSPPAEQRSGPQTTESQNRGEIWTTRWQSDLGERAKRRLRGKAFKTVVFLYQLSDSPLLCELSHYPLLRMTTSSSNSSAMEVKERRPYCSLTKGRKDKERTYAGSSGDSGDCGVGSQGPRVPTQKSYSSSETLKAFDQHQDQTRLLYGTTRGHKDMVHREQGDYSRHGQNFSLRQLGICEPAARRGLAFCSEMGLPHRGYSVGTAGDQDSDRQAVVSPEHAMRLWGRGGLVGKTSGRSSCLSSRSNSALTLTDTEHENKSDSDNDGTS
ncbi:Teneurin-3 [Merluccius polli]|uniref:Teneurin-3 n=1 Tax=Merluccius polli TaxID=89951 RepID=A0AA47MNS7_MERPO|nr:Teneurin-3 [Merluccius polli]